MKGFFCCLGGGSSSRVVQEPPENNDDEDMGPGVTFQWHEIVDGTENFGTTRFLGGGKFGEVFRCDFPKINEVGAAKIHDHENHHGHAEFLAEITMLGAANHPNVIKLIGKSFGQTKSAIVYEFMPNGSLDHHLFAHARPGPGLRQETRVLDWETRMRIAVGVAEALVYLHTGLKEIHRDVKVANILLDEDFAPKLTDFGLAIKIDENENRAEMQREIILIKGSRGYVAPEAEELGLVSTKSDVYSYGVFLLVLFTGREAYNLPKPNGKKNITDWFMLVWDSNEYMPLVIDPALGNKFPVEGLNSLFFTARMCIDAQALERPSMGFVATMIREAAAHPVTEWLPVIERRHSI